MDGTVPAETVVQPASRWSGRPIQAIALRAAVYIAPLCGSIVFVHYASKVVPAPTGSLWLFLLWWLVLSVLATGVLVVIDRAFRKLLPLAALLKLSLVFPDEAPSRFQIALRSGSVDDLAGRVAAAKAASEAATPSEAAAHLLELVAALNIHDRLTRGHCERVRAYSVLIGKELGLTSDELDLLNWAALLHDVGKLQIPGEILTKDGRPTEDEWTTLRRHPELGSELVAPIRDWLGKWTDAVGYHHERWDGAGYPHGLEAEEIPLAGRIVAVADVFDVITSARSYKKASAAEDARTEIARCAGTQFDPNVVRALLAVSLGRMRFVMGPLSWLAHAPLLGRLPLTPGLGTLAGALSVAATSGVGGLAALPSAPVAAAPSQIAKHASVTPSDRPTGAHHARVRRVTFVAHRAPAQTPAAPPVPALAPPAALTPAFVPLAAPAPAAADDQATVHEDGSVRVEVLANDTGAAPLAVQSVSPPAHGEAIVSSTSIVYHAASNFHGVDSFHYQLADASGTTATATVAVQVMTVNHAPSFENGGGVNVLEDSAPSRIPWAAAVDPGDAGQTVRFVTSSTNDGLFAVRPTIDSDGTLHFTVAPDAYGASQVTVEALDNGGTSDGGHDRSREQTFTLTILPVDDRPTFTAGGDVTVLEGAGPQSRVWATEIVAGPANEAAQRVSFATADDNPSLFTIAGQPSITPDGTLTFTAAPFASGVARVAVTAHDDGGTANSGADSSTAASFTITVTGVNQAPTFTTGGNQTVLEDTGAQSVQWATAIDPGAPDESAQTVTLSAANDNPSLFSSQPAISQTGVLTYTPAPDAYGSALVTVRAQDNGGIVNGGHDTTSRTFTLSITPVNDAPAFTTTGNLAVLENAGAQSLAWISSQSPGPANEAAQQIAYSTSNDNPALFTAGGQPTLASDGTLTFTPASNAAGTAQLTVVATDDGGTTSGGADSTTATYTLSVTGVNQAPSFSAGGAQTVREDAGAQTTPWATTIDPGAPNEASQTVTFTTSNDNNALFGTQPSLDGAGTLTYTPTPDASGVATVTVTAQDNGGTANGGHDSTTATFTITVTAVNDAPTLTAPANQSIFEDDGPQATALTSVSPGPSNEASQAVTLTTSTDHPEYFDLAGEPLVAPDGTLTFTPAEGAFGTATVTVSAQDDGGTANGGQDTTSISFLITIAPLPPNAGDDSYTTSVATPLHVGAPGVLANDADVNSSTLTVTPATIATTHGSVTINADGSFDYQPSLLFLLGGTDSFNYTITNGIGQTATGTVTISVTLLGPSTSTLYLSTSGLASGVWDLVAAPPPAAVPVTDSDGDGQPGLTITGSDGKETVNPSKKQHIWTFETGLLGLGLHGPLTLHLTAATEKFDVGKAETLWLYVYDCPGGLASNTSTSCTKIGSNKILVSKWNLTSTWAEHDAVVAIDSDLGPSRQLRLRLLVQGAPIWIPLVSPFESSIDYTG